MNVSITLRFLALMCFAMTAAADDVSDALVIGDTFEIESSVLNETRRINVFTPTVFGEPVKKPLPVLYMPDGGIDEDFLHIAGLLQVLVSNGSMRPFLLVGIENTQRRRDMTGPSDDPEDQAIAEQIGGAAEFRAFIRDELFKEIGKRYYISQERAIIGESLAGLFVVETLLHEPAMFDTYIAVDPSVWWNRYALNETAAKLLEQEQATSRRLFVAASREASSADGFQAFISGLGEPSTGAELIYSAMPEETHATLYHPAALNALRALFPADSED
ncbi:alpha/beta hydrolase [Wenzhouxiangella sp. XN201]|uniref:alpha/beta hydrolase n=1 Tax=Wenzhouxiangella sp. XN201 TaxID=2710755 RepID=UPI0013C858D0|nr:alpha/beta hydrolase-fold protein [Wenzhouxiangella sp. XN201]NEZ04945.1 alpha/beta hydrolase [Wenzhouxiangella sp. XN201]